MDIAMTREDNAVVADVLTGFVSPDVHFHALRTRESGGTTASPRCTCWCRGPGRCKQGHDLVEEVEAAVHARFPRRRADLPPRAVRRPPRLR